MPSQSNHHEYLTSRRRMRNSKALSTAHAKVQHSAMSRQLKALSPNNDALALAFEIPEVHCLKSDEH